MTIQAIILAICVNLLFIAFSGYFFWKILKTPPQTDDVED